MSGYIGTQPVPQATQTREVFTATSGQTSFATVGYPVGFVDVWLNGVKLINGTDFTATNGSDVVLTVGAAAGDTVEVISNSTFEVNSQTFTGTTTISSLVMSGAATGTDLTLSGGVYLGGTGAANLLSDYEEGTWTPTAFGGTTAGTSTYGNRYGWYTKVGNRVVLNFNMSVASMSGTGYYRIGGLPFPSDSSAGNETTGSVMTYFFSTPTGDITLYMAYGVSELRLYASNSGAVWTQVSVDSAHSIIGSITYYTSA